MSTRPTSSPHALARAHRRARAGAQVVVVAVVAVVTLVTIAAIGGPAGAQTTSLPTPPTTLPAENPGSTAAGVVFFGVTAVIIVGALVLYLRNRRPKVTEPGS